MSLVNYAVKIIDDELSRLTGTAWIESHGDTCRVEYVNGAVDEIAVTIRRVCEADS